MMTDFENIVSHIGDEKSLQIFNARIAFNRTNEFQYLRNIIETIPEYHYLLATIENTQKMYNGNLYLWGAGYYGERIKQLFHEQLAFTAVIDNNASITDFGGGTCDETRKNR